MLNNDDNNNKPNNLSDLSLTTDNQKVNQLEWKFLPLEWLVLPWRHDFYGSIKYLDWAGQICMTYFT